MLLRKMNYRYKLPLSIIFASALTAVLAIMVVSWQFYFDSKSNLAAQSKELGSSMLGMLTVSLKHKDVWHAYTMLRGLEENAFSKPKHTLILFDSKQTIFASNQPERFPTGKHISDLKADSKPLLAALKNILNTRQASELSTQQHMLSSFPLASGSIVIGNLVIADTYDSISALLKKISLQGFFVILITIGILAPIAWLWGNRIVTPLLDLESCILKVGKEPLDKIQCLVPHDHDEIGRLGLHFQNMLNDLKKKSDLEKQIVISDRLAAVGTLASGVAHEINNPIAGMIMAVDTYKQYCTSTDCKKQKNAMASIELIERGLAQIKDTVSALLVNVNVNDKPLTRIDVDDTFKLVTPKSSDKTITFDWQNDIQQTINIPSTSIRQILINLLLNAVHAADSDGHVGCQICLNDSTLAITVKNDGDVIPKNQIEHLFEPFSSTKTYGNGLGLWITYQIIQNLNGSILVESENQWTVFKIAVPIPSRELIT